MLARGDALTSRDCPAGATLPQRRLRKSVDSYLKDHRQDESNIVIEARRNQAAAKRSTTRWMAVSAPRLRAGCLDGVAGPAGDGSGCWRAARRGACERTGRARPPG